MRGIAAADIRALRAIVPEVARPSWMRETWSGSFGSRQLRPQMDDISSSIMLSPHGIAMMGSADGVVLGPRGGTVGEISRTVRIAPSGRVTISHDLLELVPAKQGTGFARGLNDHAFARYSAAGVDQVEVHASLTMGGYAWARQGFELATTAPGGLSADLERSAKLRGFIDSALLEGHIDDVTHSALVGRLVTAAGHPADAITGVQQLADHAAGSAVLRGTTWHGFRPIDKLGNWWATTTSSAGDAATGAALLSGPAAVARRAAAHLPAALDPTRAADAMHGALKAGAGDLYRDAERGARTVMTLGADDVLASIESVVPLKFGTSPQANVTVRWDAARNQITAHEYLPASSNRGRLRDALDAAWRQLGVSEVQTEHAAAAHRTAR